MAEGATLKNCQVRGPVTIGAGCRISGSTLGPYLAVGDGAEITDCHLSHTLVFAGAQLKGATLCNSIIGERVRIQGQQKRQPPVRCWSGPMPSWSFSPAGKAASR